MSTSTVSEQALVPAGTWNVDPAHSSVEFLVDAMETHMASIRGRFKDFEGTVVSEGDDVRIEGVLQTGSLATDNEQRDAHLRSPDFLAADTYPEIRFRSTGIEPRGGNELRIAGELTIRDTTFPVELDGRVVGTGQDQWGNERVALAADGGLEWGPQKVAITVNASAVKAS